MSTRFLCLYQIDDAALDSIPGFRVATKAHTREELRDAVSAVDLTAIILDLDAPDALDAIVEVHEMKPSVAIIGLVGTSGVDVIISAQRAGCKQISTKPLDVNDITVALRRALNETHEKPDNGSIIAVIGTTGGSGASTVCSYLGMEIAELTQSPTVVIDADLEFGTVALAFDAQAKYTVADIAGAGTVDSMMIESAAIKLPCGVHIISRPAKIEQGYEIDDNMMTQTIRVARNVYPYVILDLPRKLDTVTGAIMSTCDKLIIVLQATVPSVENTRRLVRTLEHFGMPPEKMEFVVNRHKKKTYNITLESLEEQLKKPLIGVVPNNYKSIAAAFDLGQPVSNRDPVRHAIRDIARKLIRSEEVPEKGSWFSGLFKGKKNGNQKTAPAGNKTKQPADAK